MRFVRNKDTGQVITEDKARKQAPADFYQHFAPVTGSEAAIAEIVHVINTHEPADRYKYMLLDRLRTDCDYFLNNGNRNPGTLWAGSVDVHLECMKLLWSSFPGGDRPEWLTESDLEQYAQDMAGQSLADAADHDRSYITV